MELPVTHFEKLRSWNRNLFGFVSKDLEHRSSDPAVKTGSPPPPHPGFFEDLYWSMFLDHARQSGYPQVATPESVAAMQRYMVSEYRAVLSFMQAGCKTFYFSEGLTEGLCCTTLRMPCEQLKLPFPAVMFVYEAPQANEALCALLNVPVEEGVVVSVYVREEVVEEPDFRKLTLLANAVRDDRVLASVMRSLALRRGWTLEQALKTDWDAPGMRADGLQPMSSGSFALGSEGDYEGGGTTLELDAFFDEGLQFVRLVVNSALYVTSRDAELAARVANRPQAALPSSQKLPGHKKAKPLPGFDSTPLSFILAGEHVEPVPIVVEPGRPMELGTPLERRGLRYKVRFMVAGTWRRKPGTPLDAPKDVWVSPHAKGPEMATLINNPYVVR